MGKVSIIVKMENKIKKLEKLVEEQYKVILRLETATYTLLDYNSESQIKISDNSIKEYDDSKKEIYYERDLSSNSWIIKEGIKF